MEASALCEVAQSLENDLIQIGSIPEMQTVLGKPFPLVLESRSEKMNFIQLQEYFINNH